MGGGFYGMRSVNSNGHNGDGAFTGEMATDISLRLC